ncbi:hypothetical protein HLASA_1109 [Halanaeroarchaeum sulfurireducens]|uniref:Uncharacterized protein n=1 Tax=Halanaeroarchaeum sulfurireducens TaxID=1604004 RepID=A0A0N9N9F7_9EURY|nr:hypothetical protein HLASA_1109 [Halanaeroarchaeum sulfurireducens]
MSDEIPPTVFTLRSNITLPLEDVHEFFESVDLPPEIEDIQIERRNNRLLISSVASDESLSKYTPTAELKAKVYEKRVYEEPPEDRQPYANRAPDEEEEPIPSELVEYARFAGRGDEVLRNTALQLGMFTVLAELALQAEEGKLTAITAVEGELEATRIVEGDDRPATVEVVEEKTESDEAQNGVDWRENEYIK